MRTIKPLWITPFSFVPCRTCALTRRETVFWWAALTHATVLVSTTDTGTKATAWHPTVGQNRKKLLLNQFLSCSILPISMFNLKVDISMLSTLGRKLFFHIQNWSSVLSKLSHAKNQVIPGSCKIVGKIIWCISAHNFSYFFNLYQRLFRFYIHPESPKLC